ncbi:DUF6516 family protein [Desulfococcaceae bacterium HSG8]|nr:DUF6516 family protein [Desulfococcaceae bacterium HSG8]
MTDTHDHLTEIKARLSAARVISSIVILEEYALPDHGYFRARLTLRNNDFLEVAEYFIPEQGNLIPKRYRYQWMNESKQVLKKRWDNVEHFPELPNFPHHIHVGGELNVEPGMPLSILELVDIIEQEIGYQDT